MAASTPHEYLRADTEAISIPVTVEDDPTGPVALPAERMVCVVGADMGRTFAIGTAPLLVGRGAGEIDLQASDVSRRHARLWRVHGAVCVEDLGSSNGTFVNGAPVRGQVQLQIGDRVQVGSTILLYTRQDELEERLQQLRKLDAMGSLVKGLAHDFNNMLAVLQAGLDELGERWPVEDPEARRTLEDMNHATESAAGLVRRLLRIGRAKPQTSELIKLSALIDETLAMARRLKLDRLRMRAHVAPEALVRGSREELKQVFLNLLINARDAMPHGGELAIEARLRRLDRATALSLHLATEGTYVDIAVIDTGCGMDQATLARIFEPFFTTKAVGKGSGLGLAMVYSSIRNHHGAVYAESVVGRGSTFRVLLPAAD